MSFSLITNVIQYTGPGALHALEQDGHQIACHDPSFVDSTTRAAFDAEHSVAYALEAQSSEAIHSEICTRWGMPDGIVSNDIHPITLNEIEAISLDDMRANFEVVVLFPVRLTELFLPEMKAHRRGVFVFVTSARETRPEPRFAVPTTLRAATIAFAEALAKEAATFGIQAKVVAPNYPYSELYHPCVRFVDDPVGRDEIAQKVPFGWLGQPDEVGALISFFASGKSPFTTGQVVSFTGGWPELKTGLACDLWAHSCAAISLSADQAVRHRTGDHPPQA